MYKVDIITAWMERRQELADEMLGLLDHLQYFQSPDEERRDQNRVAQIQAELAATDVWPLDIRPAL